MTTTQFDPTGYDFDWFAVDSEGYLVHLASAGGQLPASVTSSKEVLSQLTDFFSSLPELCPTEKIQVAAAHDGLLDTYLYYVSRGLFSFDRDMADATSGRVYLLIAPPPHPLLLAKLPDAVAALVIRTRLPFTVTGAMTIETITVV